MCIYIYILFITGQVTFHVVLDSSGRPHTPGTKHQPRAEDAGVERDVAGLSPGLASTSGVAPASPLALPAGAQELLEGVHEGVVKEYFAEKGYGFVTSGEPLRLLGKDLFFRRCDLLACTPGAAVSFRVKLDLDGRPRACEPSCPSPGAAAAAAGEGRPRSEAEVENNVYVY